ncbi:MAG: hypothetical protein GY943_38310 [Chloroflexi bacterium]|nr:hypothetical protein [Chloroflexota bacterium]
MMFKPLNNNLETKLYQWRSDDLKKYVNLLGGSSSITLKGKRITFICQKMLGKASLQLIWRELDETSKRAISTAYHNVGEFNTAAFIAQYGGLPPRPPKKQSWYYYKEPIIFDLFVIDGQIPDDLMPLLADLVLPLERFQLEGINTPPSKIKDKRHDWDIMPVETELIGRADLLTYLQMVEQKQVTFGAKNNRLTAASVRKVMTNLMDKDFRDEPESVTGRTTIRPFGLDVFAQESGLMTRTGKLTKAGRDYLHTQKPEIMLAAFEKWSDSGKYDELHRIKNLGGLKSRGTRLTPVAPRREKVIEALSWCPVDKWININDFYRAVIIWNFDFAIEKTGYANLYIGSRHYGELHGSNYWSIVNGLYINAIVWEYLGTIGAVDVAFADDEYATFVENAYDYLDEPISLFDGLLYFRINKWGAFLLGQADEYAPAQQKKKALFTINADKQIHLVADLLPNERLQIEILTTPVNKSTYQLDELKMLTAVEGGQQLDQLITFLQANHQGKLLASITSWLSQLQKNQGAFKNVGTATLIQLNQRGLATLVKQDKTLAKLCQKADSKTVLVQSSHLTRFRKRLKELGYLLT